MTLHLDQTQFPVYRRRIIKRSLPVLMLPLLYMVYSSEGSEVLPLVVAAFIVIIALVLWLTIRRQKKAWQSFTLDVHNGRVERRQDFYPAISLPFTQIREIVETPDGSFTLVARERINNIVVPFAVQSRQALLDTLQQHAPLRKARAVLDTIYMVAAGVVALVLFATFTMATNTRLRLAAGTLLCALMLWGFIEIQRNRSVDKRTKRLAFISLFVLWVFIIQLLLIWAGF